MPFVEEQKHVRTYFTMVSSILFLLFALTISVARAQDQKIENEDANLDKKTKHNVYIGGKVGLVYIFGVEAHYILQKRDINRLYLATAIQTSLIVNSVNAGGGVFLGGSGIGIGCRYHHLLWFESESDSKIQPGYGPELVWNRTIGTKYIINLHAGGIITEGSFFPDISFGVFLPLNR